MVPGCIGGRYQSDELTIDLGALAAASGSVYLQRSAVALDPATRRLTLDDGARLDYDLLSLAVGAAVSGTTLPGVSDRAVPVKPIDRALEIVPALEHAIDRAGAVGPSVAVAGAGAAGIEMALNLRARLRLLGRPAAKVTVVDGQDRILPERPAAARTAARAMVANGVETVLGKEIVEVREGEIRLAEGPSVPADLVVWATGAKAPEFIGAAGIATDDDGFLLVDDMLRCVSHPEIFGAGDAVGLRDHPGLARSGVYAVRQGPVLRDNLAAAAGRAGRLRRYRPQRRALALLNTGDGSAILSYGGLTLAGGWVMALKDRIDRRFVRRFAG
jgi:NADH dehydrogenase FAD-containing subunit